MLKESIIGTLKINGESKSLNSLVKNTCYIDDFGKVMYLYNLHTKYNRLKIDLHSSEKDCIKYVYSCLQTPFLSQLIDLSKDFMDLQFELMIIKKYIKYTLLVKSGEWSNIYE